jgi:hypothetical protein
MWKFITAYAEKISAKGLGIFSDFYIAALHKRKSHWKINFIIRKIVLPLNLYKYQRLKKIARAAIISLCKTIVIESFKESFLLHVPLAFY